MSELPTPDEMADLVSVVTRTMVGLTFVLDSGGSSWSSLVWRGAVIPIPSSPSLTIGLSSDQHGCATVSSAMYSCAPDAADDAMINDALCELVNMIAGVLKDRMAIEQASGLPKIVQGDTARYLAPSAGWRAVVLRSSDIGLVLWVAEGSAATV
jgi:hypothetical protein